MALQKLKPAELASSAGDPAPIPAGAEAPMDAAGAGDSTAPAEEGRPYLPPADDDVPVPRRGLAAARIEAEPETEEVEADSPDDLAPAPDEAIPHVLSEDPHLPPPGVIEGIEAGLLQALAELPGRRSEVAASTEVQRKAWAVAWARTKLHVAELDGVSGDAGRVDALFAQRFGGISESGFTAAAARQDVRLPDVLAGMATSERPSASSRGDVVKGPSARTPAEEDSVRGIPAGGGGTHFSVFGGFSDLFRSLSGRGVTAARVPGESQVVPALAMASPAPALGSAVGAAAASSVFGGAAWDRTQDLGRAATEALSAYRRTAGGEVWQAIEAREAENQWARGEYLKRLKAQPEAFADDPLRGQLERSESDGLTQTAKVALMTALQAYQQQLSDAVDAAKEGVPEEIAAQLDELQRDLAGIPVSDGPFQKLQEQLAKIAERIKEALQALLGGLKGPG